MIAIDVCRVLAVGRYPVSSCSTNCLSLRIKLKPVQLGKICYIACCIFRKTQTFFHSQLLHLFQKLVISWLESIGFTTSFVYMNFVNNNFFALFLWIFIFNSINFRQGSNKYFLDRHSIYFMINIKSTKIFFQAVNIVINKDRLLIGLSFSWKCVI